MTCLRVSIREWTEGDPVALCPFSVACYAETYDGKNYRHCNSLHKTTVPEGIEGNRYEPLACLSRAEESWSNYGH
ncbi:hypothetical protein N7527_005863 [Penicillium freii]|nr:hypothetical protein N7527_005863 [Penicillium freii]